MNKSMNVVYVVMYRTEDAVSLNVLETFNRPYAVFTDRALAKKLMREGDEIVEVPFILTEGEDADTSKEAIQ